MPIIPAIIRTARRLALVVALVATTLLASCAMIMSSRTTDVTFHSRPDSATVRIDGDTAVYVTPATIEIERSSRPRTVTVVRDGRERSFRLEPYPSTTYWFGNVVTWGVGHLVDLLGESMYTYDGEVFVALDDSLTSYPAWRYGMFRPGDLRIGGSASLMTMTFVSGFWLDTGGGRWRTGGPFINLSASGDLFVDDASFVRADLRVLTDAVGECFGDCGPSVWQLSGAALYGHDWNRIALALGPRYGVNTMRYRDTLAPHDVPMPFLGATLSLSYRLALNTWLVADVTPSIGLGEGRSGGLSVDGTLRLLFASARSTPW